MTLWDDALYQYAAIIKKQLAVYKTFIYDLNLRYPSWFKDNFTILRCPDQKLIIVGYMTSSLCQSWWSFCVVDLLTDLSVDSATKTYLKIQRICNKILSREPKLYIAVIKAWRFLTVVQLKHARRPKHISPSYRTFFTHFFLGKYFIYVAYTS